MTLITKASCAHDDCGDEFGWTLGTSSGITPQGMQFDAFEKSSEPNAGPPDLSAIAGLRFDLSGIDEFEIDDLRFY